MGYAIHGKDPRSGKEFEACTNRHGEVATVERWRSKASVHIQEGIKVSPAQTVETIAKMVQVTTPQFIEIKSGRNTFLGVFNI